MHSPFSRTPSLTTLSLGQLASEGGSEKKRPFLDGGRAEPQTPLVTCRMATSFLSWLSCLVGKRSLSMTFTATSRPVFRCFPGQGVGKVVGEHFLPDLAKETHPHPHPNSETQPALDKGGWKASKMALRPQERWEQQGALGIKVE